MYILKKVVGIMVDSIKSRNLSSQASPLQNVKKILEKSIENSEEKFILNDISNVKIESSDDAAIKRKIQELKAYEQMVIAHEHKHMLAGGGVASAPTYIYTYGPDGRKYVSGGNVSMRVPKGGSAEQLIENLRRVQAAALAPSNPSPADIQSAAMARARESSIRSEYRVKKAREKYAKQQQVANHLKDSKLKSLDTLDRLIERSYDSAISRMNHEIKMSFEMMI